MQMHAENSFYSFKTFSEEIIVFENWIQNWVFTTGYWEQKSA